LHYPNRFSVGYFDADARADQYRVNTATTVLRFSDNRKLRACSAERTLVEIVVRIAHVRVFRLVTDFRREFRVTAMDVRNV
jgi:hypothetical protein